MTDVVSARRKIQIEEVKYRSGISENTLTKVGASVNWILDNSVNNIGDIIPSVLSLPQFQSLYGPTWVLMDGSSIAGSDLATLTGITTLPNMVGNQAHLQQSDSDANIGNFVPNSNKEHFHYVANNTSLEVGSSIPSTPSANDSLGTTFTDVAAQIPNFGLFTNNETAANVGRSSVASTGQRSNPDSYKINFFIKINN
jgi:hypothetical protein